MDVLVRLSLAGGHSWEFVCDSEDSMVHGVVSALPGASLDPALPPDGLVQVESRRGERFFFSRSSLVSVSVQPVVTQAPQVHAMPSVCPSPFVCVPNLLSAQDLDSLHRLSAREFAGGVDALPDSARAGIGRALAEACARLRCQTDEEAHLYLDILAAQESRAPFPAMPSGKRPLLDVLLVLRSDAPIAIALPDCSAGGVAGLDGVRELRVPENAMLCLPRATPEDKAAGWIGPVDPRAIVLHGQFGLGSEFDRA